MACGIATFLQHPRERDFLSWKVASVRMENSIAVMMATGQTGSPCGRANGIASIKMGHCHAAFGERVEAGRLNDGVAIEPSVAVAKIISKNDHDVRRLVGAGG